MKTDFMKGVVVPILTVIDENEKIDEAGMRAQVDYVIEGGVSGILCLWLQRRVLYGRRGRNGAGT